MTLVEIELEKAIELTALSTVESLPERECWQARAARVDGDMREVLTERDFGIGKIDAFTIGIYA